MALVVDGAPKPGAEDARPPEGRGERPGQEEQEEQQEEEDAAGAPRGRAGKSGEQEPRPSREWEEAPRWSKMDQLAQELTAGKRLDGEDEEDDPGPDPDRSMKLSFRARAFGPRGPDLQLRRGWRPSSREDSVEAGLPLQARGYPEEKKEEEGSANRRAEVRAEVATGGSGPGQAWGQLHSDITAPCRGPRPLESRPRGVRSQGLSGLGVPGLPAGTWGNCPQLAGGLQPGLGAASEQVGE